MTSDRDEIGTAEGIIHFGRNAVLPDPVLKLLAIRRPAVECRKPRSRHASIGRQPIGRIRTSRDETGLLKDNAVAAFFIGTLVIRNHAHVQVGSRLKIQLSADNVAIAIIAGRACRAVLKSILVAISAR